MKPAWSVILLTTLIGAGQGLFLVVFAAVLFRSPPREFVLLCGCAVLGLLAAGLFASFFHLGRPWRAWRAVTQWRTSWLSREVIVLPAFMGCVFAFLISGSFLIGALASLLCIALFLCTGMIYACLRFVQEWASFLTPVNFALLGLASGATLAVPLAALAWPPSAAPLALAAGALGAVAWLARGAALVRNARLRPKSSVATAIGVTGARIAQISQGFTGGSYNTSEFLARRPGARLALARTLFIVLFFAVLWAACALQFAGLLAERWTFFAEARHPQNLYYQAKA